MSRTATPSIVAFFYWATYPVATKVLANFKIETVSEDYGRSSVLGYTEYRRNMVAVLFLSFGGAITTGLTKRHNYVLLG